MFSLLSHCIDFVCLQLAKPASASVPFCRVSKLFTFHVFVSRRPVRTRTQTHTRRPSRVAEYHFHSERQRPMTHTLHWRVCTQPRLLLLLWLSLLDATANGRRLIAAGKHAHKSSGNPKFRRRFFFFVHVVSTLLLCVRTARTLTIYLTLTVNVLRQYESK